MKTRKICKRALTPLLLDLRANGYKVTKPNNVTYHAWAGNECVFQAKATVSGFIVKLSEEVFWSAS